MLPAFLIQIIICLIVVGLLLWLVNFLPIEPAIKQIIRVVVIVFIVIWLLYALMGAAPVTYPFRR